MDPLVGATGEPYAYTADNPINGIDPYGLWCVGRVCSDQVGHVLGQIGNHAGTIAPVAIYGAVLTGAVVCAYFTLGVCVAADVATGGLLFAGGTFLVSATLPLEEGLGPNQGGDSCVPGGTARQEPDLEALSASGRAMDRNALTRAGRSYQKHMDRLQLPLVAGSQLNQAGQDLLDEILSNPGTVRSSVSRGVAAGGMRFVGPDGIGATFNAAGQFVYFGRYARP